MVLNGNDLNVIISNGIKCMYDAVQSYKLGGVDSKDIKKRTNEELIQKYADINIIGERIIINFNNEYFNITTTINLDDSDYNDMSEYDTYIRRIINKDISNIDMQVERLHYDNNINICLDVIQSMEPLLYKSYDSELNNLITAIFDKMTHLAEKYCKSYRTIIHNRNDNHLW